MPRGRDAGSLKQICVGVIAGNFDRLYACHFERQFGDIPRILHVIGPFDNLPGDLCQDILQELLKRRLLRPSHLQLLLLPQISCVNLSSAYSNSVTALTLDLLSVRCKSLVSLNLANCMSVSSKAVTGCLRCLPQLHTLVLKQTKLGDEVLRVVASHLPLLTHLNLHACPVTDRGAGWLCGDHGDFDPVCTKLSLLDIRATKINLDACSLILRCFPHLRYLSYPDSIGAVALLHTKSCFNSRDRLDAPSAGTSDKNDLYCQHHLLKLEILYATALRCKRVESESVQLACHSCPNVREVYWYQDATDQSLTHLRCLEQLSVLEVTSDRPQAVTFHGGVLPLLRGRGEAMAAVGLYDVQDVDLGLLGWLCPRLQRLKLVSMHGHADFARSFLTSHQQAASFTSLVQLTLVCGSSSTRLETQDLQNVLVNAASLQELHLIAVHCLTDVALVSAISVHGFPHLRQVQFESCDQITTISVSQLLGTCNPLSQLTLKQCPLISYQDYQHLCSLAALQGVHLNIDWD